MSAGELLQGRRVAGRWALAYAPAWQLLARVWRNRRILLATTRSELSKRYSGSALGPLWLVLQPALLLAIYLFVYLVVFRVRFPGYGTWDYVLFIFCGLIPYLGLSEAITTGCPVIKQNLHLVKNVLLPIDLITVRAVLMAMFNQLVSLALLIALLLVTGRLGPGVLGLPLVVVLQTGLLVGVVMVLAPLALVLPDIGYFVNLFTVLLLFVSPIGFRAEMVPSHWRFVVTLNPVTYLIEAYRAVLLGNRPASPVSILVFAALCLTAFSLGSAFFQRFKDVLVDFE